MYLQGDTENPARSIQLVLLDCTGIGFIVSGDIRSRETPIVTGVEVQHFLSGRATGEHENVLGD